MHSARGKNNHSVHKYYSVRNRVTSTRNQGGCGNGVGEEGACVCQGTRDGGDLLHSWKGGD